MNKKPCKFKTPDPPEGETPEKQEDLDVGIPDPDKPGGP